MVSHCEILDILVNKINIPTRSAKKSKIREREGTRSNTQHSPFLHVNQSVLCIICILDFSDQKLWDCLGLLRMRIALKE